MKSFVYSHDHQSKNAFNRYFIRRGLQLREEPNGHSIYMFCEKRCDRIKVLFRESDGFVLLYKKLDVIQGRYRWPRNKSEVKSITWQQFDWLMSGLDIEQPKALRTV